MEPFEEENWDSGVYGIRNDKDSLFVLYVGPDIAQWPEITLPPGSYETYWYDPTKGGSTEKGKTLKLKERERIRIEYPSHSLKQDWVVLLAQNFKNPN